MKEMLSLTDSNSRPMSRRKRLRRVALLCSAFTTNAAYYRIGTRAEYSHLRDQNTFWRTANSNFLDTCVLEWCKLFGDEKGQHYWGNIVAEPKTFQANLLSHLGVTEAAFKAEIQVMRQYRDKFLAHLDSELKMQVPTLDVAMRAVWFYQAHLVSSEAKPGDLIGLDADLEGAFEILEARATEVYWRNA